MKYSIEIRLLSNACSYLHFINLRRLSMSDKTIRFVNLKWQLLDHKINDPQWICSFIRLACREPILQIQTT